MLRVVSHKYNQSSLTINKPRDQPFPVVPPIRRSAQDLSRCPMVGFAKILQTVQIETQKKIQILVQSIWHKFFNWWLLNAWQNCATVPAPEISQSIQLTWMFSKIAMIFRLWSEFKYKSEEALYCSADKGHFRLQKPGFDPERPRVH